MYRKIIFIEINILPINPFTKVTLLILIALIAIHLTFFLRPFIFDEVGKIELSSLLSAIITLFSGALYICDIGDELKIINFATIILVNTSFCVIWLSSLLRIVFQTNIDKLQRIFPRCTYFIIACILSLLETKKSINVVSYVKNMRKNFQRFRRSLRKRFEIKTSGKSNQDQSKLAKISQWRMLSQK